MNDRRLPGLGHQRAGRHQTRPMARLKAAKLVTLGSTANATIAASNGGGAYADHEAHRRGVGLVGARREQDDADRGKGDGQRAVRPCGHDPEELDGTDRDEGARRIDESGKPIGHTEPDGREAQRMAGQDRPARPAHRAPAAGRAAPRPSGRRAAAATACWPAERQVPAPPRRRAGRRPADRPSSVSARPATAPSAAPAGYFQDRFRLLPAFVDPAATRGDRPLSASRPGPRTDRPPPSAIPANDARRSEILRALRR